MNGIQIIVFGLIICFGLVAGGIAIFQHKSVYHFVRETGTPAQYGLKSVREMRLVTPGQEDLRVWVSDPIHGAPLIISFYGNFSKFGPSAEKLKPFLDKGYGVAIAEYRGVETSGEGVRETDLVRDALRLFNQVDTLLTQPVPSDRRVIHGFSLGTSIAVQVAATYPVGAVVLEAGFDQLCRFQQRRLKGIPMCLLMWRERHDVIKSISNVSTPLLIAHGDQDTSIPVEWARPLYGRANEPKEMVVYDEGTHTNLMDVGLATDMDEFIRSALPN